MVRINESKDAPPQEATATADECWSIGRLRDFHALWISAIVLVSVHVTVAFLSPKWEFFPNRWPFVASELLRWLVWPLVVLMAFGRLGRVAMVVLGLAALSPFLLGAGVDYCAILGLSYAVSWILAPLLGVSVAAGGAAPSNRSTFQWRLTVIAIISFAIAVSDLLIPWCKANVQVLGAGIVARAAALAIAVAVSLYRIPLVLQVALIAGLLCGSEAAAALVWSYDLLARGIGEWLAEAIAYDSDIWPYVFTDMGMFALGTYFVIAAGNAAGYRVLVSQPRSNSGQVGVWSLAMLVLLAASLLSLRKELPSEPQEFSIGAYSGKVLLGGVPHQVDFTAQGVVTCTSVEAIPLRERDFTSFLSKLDLQDKVTESDLDDLRKIKSVLCRELCSSYPGVDWDDVVVTLYRVTKLDKQTASK